jgi:hypothetical protein
MAKASESLVAIGNPHNPAIIAAAAEILGLINSKANSPTRDEIAAIIAKAALPAQLGEPTSSELAKWDAKVRKYIEDQSRLTDDEADEECGRLIEASEEIWARPVRGWDDIALRAAMAVYWNNPGSIGGLGYPSAVFAPSEMDDLTGSVDERALAHLVRAILDLAGLKFDSDGVRVG